LTHDARVVFRAGAIGDSPPTVDAAHVEGRRRRVDLAAAGAQTTDVSAVYRGDVDLAGARFDQTGADPVRSDHLRQLRGFGGVDLAHVGHQLDHALVHGVQVLDVVVWARPRSAAAASAAVW
jgi:hypothetical protein